MGIVLFALSCAAHAQVPPVREASVPVLIDGSLAGSALVRDGVAYLPLRSVGRVLGLDVSYDADAQLILIRTPKAEHRGARTPPVQ